MAQLVKQSDSSVCLKGKLDSLDLNTLRSAGDSLIRESGDTITFDVQELETANSVALSLLLVWMKSARQHHKELVIKNMSAQLYDMARVGGLESILNLAKS
jgi:phospholipid transport system transporter-binding protein